MSIRIHKPCHVWASVAGGITRCKVSECVSLLIGCSWLHHLLLPCPSPHPIGTDVFWELWSFQVCDNRRRKKTWCLVKFIKLGSFLSVTVGVPTFWSPNSLNNWLIKIYGRKDAFFQGVIFKLLPRFNPCNYIVGFIGLILLQKPYSPQDFSFFLVDPLFDRCVIYLLAYSTLFACLPS